MNTRGITKLINDEGRCYWHHGADMVTTLKEGMAATGRKRDCAAARQAAQQISDSRLRTALECGYTRIVECEEPAYNSRRSVSTDIKLPKNADEAVRKFNEIRD